uniref:Uncharacterized protein n=1 Tax=Arundo donax TaxID=35708 RepID=A0A0A9C530_ARUDO
MKMWVLDVQQVLYNPGGKMFFMLFVLQCHEVSETQHESFIFGNTILTYGNHWLF